MGLLRTVHDTLRVTLTRKPVVLDCFCWVSFREDDGAVYSGNQLRGAKHWELEIQSRKALRRLRRTARFGIRPKNDHIGYVLVNKLAVTPCPAEILITEMPGTTKIVELYQDRYVAKMPVVTDVTADVLNLIPEPSDAMKRAAQVAYGVTPDGDTVSYWTQPDVLRNFKDCLLLSTVVTTSWHELVQPLQELVGDDTPVIHVPDLHDNYESIMQWHANMELVVTAINAVMRRR